MFLLILLSVQLLTCPQSGFLLANRFLPTDLQYAALHIEVKPLRRHWTWKSPRTFVFNDMTTAEMFLNSFPELLADPANKAIADVLELMRSGSLDKAEEEIGKLLKINQDLPPSVRLSIFYEKACIHALRAWTSSDGSPARESELDRSVDEIQRWFELGNSGAWDLVGRTASAEVHRMASDRDLALVCEKRRINLERAISKELWPKGGGRGGGSSGCFPRGALIDTPQGSVPIELLRPGDLVWSVQLSAALTRVMSRIAAVSTSRATRCIRLNGKALMTPTQPVRKTTEWAEAGTLTSRDIVLDGRGDPNPVSNLQVVESYFEIYEMMTEDAMHNFVANGILLSQQNDLYGA